MRIVGTYSFNGGERAVRSKYPRLLAEVEQVIAGVDAVNRRTKTSREKTMPGKMLYSPKALNKDFKIAFHALGWNTVRVKCQYDRQHYAPGYAGAKAMEGAFREMDFVRDKLGVEVQFGKYSFMVYNVCAKMTIFHNLGYIGTGIEIVPVKELADDMSTGVSYFEQFVWDLEQRGVSDIDIPVLVLGISAGRAGTRRSTDRADRIAESDSTQSYQLPPQPH